MLVGGAWNWWVLWGGGAYCCCGNLVGIGSWDVRLSRRGLVVGGVPGCYGDVMILSLPIGEGVSWWQQVGGATNTAICSW